MGKPRAFRISWAAVGIYLLLATVVAGGVMILRRKDLPRSSMIPSTMLQMEPSLELRFDDVVMRGRDNGTPRWEIRAQSVSVSQNQRTVYFDKHPHGEFLNLKDWSDKKEPGQPVQAAPDKKRSVSWDADKAEYDNDAEEMTISGHGHFVTDEQDVMTTDRVKYRVHDHQVLVQAPVRLDSHDHKLALRAQEATADTQFEVLELGGRVEIDSKINEGDKL